MADHNEDLKEDLSDDERAQTTSRKTYVAPKLVTHGTVQDVTQAGAGVQLEALGGSLV